MIKLVLKEAYSIHEAIAHYFSSSNDPIKGKVGFALRYNFKILHDALEVYIEKRDGIIKKYADPVSGEVHNECQEKGIPDPVIVSNKENLKKANEEIKEFEDLEIELPIITVTLDDVMNTDGIDSSNAEILIWMTKEYLDSRKDKK